MGFEVREKLGVWEGRNIEVVSGSVVRGLTSLVHSYGCG